MRTTLLRLCCIGAGLLLWASASAQSAPLFTIPTDGALPPERAPDAVVNLALYSRDVAALAAFLQIDPGGADGRIEYALGAYRPLAVDAKRTWLESTFVVDHQERETMNLYAELVASKGASPSPAQLIEFVAHAVKGSLGRGWDSASIVAGNRTGDCTEYAVLLTALSRAAARRARVVTGAVVVETEQGPATYGHAWSEIDDGGNWRVADAALTQAKVIGYIPIGVLADESASFTLDLARYMQVWIQRVQVLGTATPARP